MGQKTERDMAAVSWSCGMWPSQMSQAHSACGGGEQGGLGLGAWVGVGLVGKGEGRGWGHKPPLDFRHQRCRL